jgi:hypothetical protein
VWEDVIGVTGFIFVNASYSEEDYANKERRQCPHGFPVIMINIHTHHEIILQATNHGYLVPPKDMPIKKRHSPILNKATPA